MEQAFERHLTTQLEIVPNGYHEEYGKVYGLPAYIAIISRDDHILLRCYGCGGRHNVPRSL